MDSRIAAALALVACLFGSVPVLGGVEFEYPYRRPDQSPFRAGERHEMQVSYLGLPGLHVTFEVLPTEHLNGRKVHHVKGHVRNSMIVGFFIRIRNSVESWFDFDGLFSHRLHLIQDQSNLQRDSLEVHDHQKAQTHFINRVRKGSGPEQVTEERLPIAQFAQDTFSAFYYLRTQPLNDGASFVVQVISDGRMVQAQVTPVKRDKIEFDDREIPAVAVKLEKIGPDGKPIPSENLVWLSDDSRRMLLRVDVHARFGHVVLKLKNYVEGQDPAYAMRLSR